MAGNIAFRAADYLQRDFRVSCTHLPLALDDFVQVVPTTPELRTLYFVSLSCVCPQEESCANTDEPEITTSANIVADTIFNILIIVDPTFCLRTE